MKTRELLAVSCLLLTLPGTSACGDRGPDGSSDRLQPAYDESTGRLKRLSYDSDGDGTMDTWGVMDGARVIRVEADENQDGKLDRWEYHRDATSGTNADATNPLETVERIERSTRHDGQVSRWEYFEKGALVRVEEDTTGDGKIDKWEAYASGALKSMGLDTDGDGQADRTLVYKADGSLDRIETSAPSAQLAGLSPTAPNPQPPAPSQK